MLTCEEIAERVAAMRLPVTRESYRSIAEQIHPRVRQPEFDRRAADDDSDPADDPEWCEHYRRPHGSADWTDMVIFCVTLWQWYAAYEQRRVGAILERE
jgi:hypothetical protein